MEERAHVLSGKGARERSRVAYALPFATQAGLRLVDPALR
jgi:hypothetical protein